MIKPTSHRRNIIEMFPKIMCLPLLIWITLAIISSINSETTPSVDFSPTQRTSSGNVQYEPEVAVLCDKSGSTDMPYYNQYLSGETGKWMTDPNTNNWKMVAQLNLACSKKKLSILKYCKQMYPYRDIRNIVESNRYIKIGGWCKFGKSLSKCPEHSAWVKPYRCLEGQFQSDALLVPDHCVFDHIHNQSLCLPYDRWNQSAQQACVAKHGHNSQLKSFAMLLPCGVSVFSGVEFVCCPSDAKTTTSAPIETDDYLLDDKDDAINLIDDDDIDDDLDDEDDDDDEGDDEEDADDDYEESDETWTGDSSAQPTDPTVLPAVTLSTPDPYFTHFDPRIEHKAYKEAKKRLDVKHRIKINKIMKDWSDLEERYQDMRRDDPHAAQIFKDKMTSRFQQTVQLLEEQQNGEVHKLISMHQQRIVAHIDQLKKTAMTCYTRALDDNPPSGRKIQKCLQSILRVLHKDRYHTISHYRHLLSSNFELAVKEKAQTVEHLVDIANMANQSLQMLHRYPALSAKITPLMLDYMDALRSKDGLSTLASAEAESQLLDRYKDQAVAAKRHFTAKRVENMEVAAETVHKELPPTTVPTTHYATAKNMRKTPRSAESERIDSDLQDILRYEHRAESLALHETVAEAPRRRLVLTELTFWQHVMFSSPTIIVAILTVVAFFYGLAVLKHRRIQRNIKKQGFIEVSQHPHGLPGTPQEDKHLAQMQINGYENPTYKYFELKA